MMDTGRSRIVRKRDQVLICRPRWRRAVAVLHRDVTGIRDEDLLLIRKLIVAKRIKESDYWRVKNNRYLLAGRITFQDPDGTGNSTRPETTVSDLIEYRFKGTRPHYEIPDTPYRSSTLRIRTKGGGTVKGNWGEGDEFVAPDQTWCKVEAIPDEGWEFDHWHKYESHGKYDYREFVPASRRNPRTETTGRGYAMTRRGIWVSGYYIGKLTVLTAIFKETI